MVPSLEWWSNGHTLVTDMKVLDLPTYDAILGYDWLSSNSPMTCDWANKAIQFHSNGQLINLLWSEFQHCYSSGNINGHTVQMDAGQCCVVSGCA